MVKQSTQAYLDTLELDEAGQTRAEIALALAAQLDRSVDSASAGVVQAFAGLARELRETLAEIGQMHGEAEEFVGEIFALPGKSAA